MSNLASTVPSVCTALYDLLSDVGARQRPPVRVYDTLVSTSERPAQYALLGPTLTGHHAVEGHVYSPAALGSYAQYEEYEVWGYVTYFQGDIDPGAVRSATWALYESVVMSTVVENRGQGGNPLGLVNTLVVLPTASDYICDKGAQGGFWGAIEFAFHVKARLTVP